MLKELKEQVCSANQALKKHGLVTLTWGNVSGIDRESGLVVIKPSGISYADLNPSQMNVVDLSGKIIEGNLKPSSDTPTHLELYRAFQNIGGITHTHSDYAVIFAQAKLEVPCFGTTHADHFNGPVPLTRLLTWKEVKENYELFTGKVIVERMVGLNPLEMPAVLVAGHGPFTWGKTPIESVDNNLALEKVAKTALGILQINPNSEKLPDYILQKHYQRKHGPDAYYGQKKPPEST